MAKRNTVAAGRRAAVSCRPRFSVFCNASRISGASISAIDCLPNSKIQELALLLPRSRGIALRFKVAHERSWLCFKGVAHALGVESDNGDAGATDVMIPPRNALRADPDIACRGARSARVR